MQVQRNRKEINKKIQQSGLKSKNKMMGCAITSTEELGRGRGGGRGRGRGQGRERNGEKEFIVI